MLHGVYPINPHLLEPPAQGNAVDEKAQPYELLNGLATAEFIESPNLRLALTAGLCGGYSTLAAFAFENTMLFRAGNFLTAGSYIAATLVGSIISFIAGYAAANCCAR